MKFKILVFILFILHLLLLKTALSYDVSKVPSLDLGRYSRFTDNLFGQRGSGTSGIWWRVNPTQLQGTGTTGVMGSSSATANLPRIGYDFATSKWRISNDGITIVDVETTGNNIANNNGHGSSTTLQDTTHIGTDNLASGFSENTNGHNVSDVELSYLDGVYDGLQTQLDAKVGSTTPRIAAIQVGGSSTSSSGSETVAFAGSGDITTSMADNGGGKYTVIIAGSLGANAKPDVYQNGSLVTTAATNHDFKSPLTATTDGGGSDIGLDENLVGTSTPGINKIVRSDVSGKIASGWLPQTTIVYQCIVGSSTTTYDLDVTIPDDNTKPQNTEGTEIFTQNFTPVRTDTIIDISWTIPFGCSDASKGAIFALFQDSQVDALSSYSWVAPAASIGGSEAILNYRMPSPGTSTTTFKVRAGKIASASSLYINRSSSGATLGGTIISTVRIMEYK